jgi:uncharacterized protein
MGFDQYHEPAGELSAQTRTFARMCANLTEEAEAIGWYEQRISLERDPAARAIMLDSLGEEYKHFSMELEYLFRSKPQWREIARGILFRDGDIVAHAQAAEAAATEGAATASGTEAAPGAAAPDEPAGPAPGSGPRTPSPDTSLGIGSLKEQTLWP